MKTCTKCNITKDYSFFSKNRNHNDGHEYWCKECLRKYRGHKPRNDLNNLRGKRFGRLVAIEPTEKRKNNHVVWVCQCDCGNIHEVISSVLVSGLSNSCGCWRKDRMMKHSGSGTRLYQIWKLIRSRCNNPNNQRAHRYGGRGIKVCTEWDNFKTFREWALQNGYKDPEENEEFKHFLSIDRIYNNGNYCPDNCQFITVSENSIKGDS